MTYGIRERRVQCLPVTTAKYMQCHYCDSEADIAVEKDGITVGVCEPHFREQLDELEDSEWLEELDEELNIDRSE